MCNTNPNGFFSPQRERSLPVFIPSKPSKRIGRRHRQKASRPTFAELPDSPPAGNQVTSPFPVNTTNSPNDIAVRRYEAAHLNQKVQSPYKHSSGSAEAASSELSREVSRKQQTLSRSFAYEGRKRGECKVQFDEIPTRVAQRSREADCAWTAVTERPPDPSSCPPRQLEMQANGERSPAAKAEKEYFRTEMNASSLRECGGLSSTAAESEQRDVVKSRELSQSFPNPCILPRPPVLPGIVGKQDSPLLDLQNSFSKTTAHHDFNSSLTYAAVNLNDNVVAGKKHSFYGINSCYLRG